MRLLYRPFGLILGVLAGRVAAKTFTALWQRIDGDSPPAAASRAAGAPRVVAAAALEGLVLSGTRAAFDRGGKSGFERLFGVWPGEKSATATPAGDEPAGSAAPRP